jgi:hypothetical protein
MSAPPSATRPGRPGRDRRPLPRIRLRKDPATSARRSPTSASAIRSRSTMTGPSGAPSTTATGRRITSPTPRAGSATIISAKAAKPTRPKPRSAPCSPRPAKLAGPWPASSRPAGQRHGRRLRRDRSPETYVGFGRARISSRPAASCRGKPGDYRLPDSFALNEWAYGGRWTVEEQRGRLEAPDGGDRLPLQGPRPAPRPRQRDGKPIRFRVCSTARRPAPTTASTSTPRAMARSPTSASTSWSARRTAPRAAVHDHLPRPRRRGLRLHLRLTVI